MSGALAIRAAMLGALRDDVALAGLVNQIGDGPPAASGSTPWLALGEGSATAWGARAVDGVALRQPVQLMMRGDDMGAASAIAARVDAVLAALGGDVGGWRITSLRLERSRMARTRGGWRVDMDFAVRAARVA